MQQPYVPSDYEYAASPSHTAARVLLALMQTPSLLRPGYFPSSVHEIHRRMNHILSPDTLILHSRVYGLEGSMGKHQLPLAGL